MQLAAGAKSPAARQGRMHGGNVRQPVSIDILRHGYMFGYDSVCAAIGKDNENVWQIRKNNGKK
jgi:hypothetical protein